MENGTTLPDGLNLSTVGVISGTPTTAGTVNFTVKATNSKGSDTKALSITITKATQTAPAAPTLLNKTATSITLNTITGCEYRMNGGAWQTATLFSGLEPNTTYSFEAYKVETATHLASPVSTATQLATDKATLSGTVTISGDAVFGETLTANTGLTSTPEISDLGMLIYQWKRRSENIGTNSTTYTLLQADIGATITVTVTAANCNGSVTSAATATVIKASEITPPDAPTLANNSSNSITLNTITGCEYRMNGGAWQSSTTFSGLAPDTEYEFEARKAETATHFASPASEKVIFSTTNVGIDDMTMVNGELIILIDNGQLTIDNGKGKIDNVAIYDLLGRLVGAYPCGRPDSAKAGTRESANAADAITIDVSHLPRGAYIIKVDGKTGRFVKK
jgi:hypothetical protein